MNPNPKTSLPSLFGYRRLSNVPAIAILLPASRYRPAFTAALPHRVQVMAVAFSRAFPSRSLQRALEMTVTRALVCGRPFNESATTVGLAAT